MHYAAHSVFLLGSFFPQIVSFTLYKLCELFSDTLREKNKDWKKEGEKMWKWRKTVWDEQAKQESDEDFFFYY